MKKIIYLLLVVFGMSTPKTMYAQEILGVYPHYDSPCEGTVVNIFVDRSQQNAVDSVVWTKNGSKSALPIGWNSDPITGNVDCYGFSVVDNGNYEVTCYLSNGSTEMVNIQLSVNPNPNAGYSLITKCNSVELIPSGGDYYMGLDHGDYTVPFFGDTLTGTGLLLPGGGFRAFTTNGCYSDVIIGQIWANPLVVSVTPTKWSIGPGQSSTITASANWPTVMSKTKWFKNNLLYAQGCNTLTVTDTGTYKVQMRATVASGNCVKAKQIRIKAKTIAPGARVGEEGGEFESIEGQESVLDLQVGPNPASDQIQITGYDQEISILDVNGRMIQYFELDTFSGNENPQIVDVTYLPNGIYFIRSGGQAVKLLVQR